MSLNKIEHTSDKNKNPEAKNFLFLFLFSYVILFMNSFSFPHPLIPDTGKYFSALFELLARFTGKYIFNLDETAVYELVSDSAGMYLHSLNLIFMSLFIAFIWYRFAGSRINYLHMRYWFSVIVRYYLALHLISYGFAKVFKWQFFFPEPNTLFTPVGEVPRDLLYWSTMGLSRGYNVFMGLAEIVAGCLLLFRRTTPAGAVIAFAILVNVLAVNISFDISVKLFSAFLLFLSFILIAPNLKSLFRFFVGGANAAIIKQTAPVINARFYWGPKIIVVCWILLSALWPYFKSGNFNDDASQRPFLHGAYTTTFFVRNNDTLQPLLTDKCYWKRVFVHRQNYFIVQKMNDEMSDFEVRVDSVQSKLHLMNYVDSTRCVLNYRISNDTLHLRGNFFNEKVDAILRKENLSGLWLMKDEFHWTIHK